MNQRINRGPNNQGLKLLSVLLLTLLLSVSATAQINWMKQDGDVKYLAWDNGSKSKTIYNGNSAVLTTGYFGSTAGKTVHLTVTINSKADGKIVNTIVSEEVNVANTLGYQVISVLPEHYKNKIGEYIIVIKLKDANTEQVDSSLYLNVKSGLVIQDIPPIYANKNTAPQMDNLLNKKASENKNLQFTVSASDAQNDDLEYEAKACWKVGSTCLWVNTGFFGASFNEDTGKFSWTPSYDFVKHPNLSRDIDFRFRADDGKKKSDWKKITITVSDVNRNPLFDKVADQVIEEGQELKFTVHANDADGDALQYGAASQLPQGASFDANLQQFKWIPATAQAGIYYVTFKADDNFGGKDFVTVKIEVTEKPAASTQCNDGIDNDGDGVADADDPGCHTDGNAGNTGTYDANDNDEKDEQDDPDDEPADTPQCNDGVDNDADGKADFPNDPGCSSSEDNDETDEEPEDDPNDEPADTPQCNDGVDNDADGKADFPNDPGCSSSEDNDETDNDTIPPAEKPKVRLNIKLQSVHLQDETTEPRNILFVNARIFNNGDKDLDELKVQAKIYDLGVWGSTGEFTLKTGKGTDKNVFVYLPEDAEDGAVSGWHLVKVTVSNSHYHTSTHRLVYINNNTPK